MFTVSLVNPAEDFEQILSLQQENLRDNINEEEMRSQGFVTLRHNPVILQKMHDLAPSVVAKDNGKVVAYALVLLQEAKPFFPYLESRLDRMSKLDWKGKSLDKYRYYIMGQICVSKQYRGQGLVEMLYQKHREVYSKQFDFVITEIALRNVRSLRAHEKVGFTIINTHKDAVDDWAIVLWNWS